MRRTRQSIEAEQKFRDAVEEFNQKHNRHIEIAGKYQGSKKPVDFYEKTVINDKTYKNSWIQQPCEFENGHEGNPLLKHKDVLGTFEEMVSKAEKAEKDNPDNKKEEYPAN